jgi:hypothetical protein
MNKKIKIKQTKTNRMHNSIIKKIKTPIIKVFFKLKILYLKKFKVILKLLSSISFLFNYYLNIRPYRIRKWQRCVNLMNYMQNNKFKTKKFVLSYL